MEKTIANYPVKAVGAEEVLQDFYICSLSREFSMFIRKEVLTGKAKFGVSDDGKELFQIAMAKAFKRGDFRADYYRGHTLLLALGIASLEDMFAQLYADGDNDPFSGGRQMNNHHATRFVDEEGNWLPLRELYNLSSDVSTTAGQMARGSAWLSPPKSTANPLILATRSSPITATKFVFASSGTPAPRKARSGKP